MQTVDTLILNAHELITCASTGAKRGLAMRDVGAIPNGAIAIQDGKILAVGTTADIQAAYTSATVVDASGKSVCPAFVDPHTHVVYAGDRVAEFEMRIQGKSYMEIMAAGGGILSTMQHTRQASIEELVNQTRPRLETMLQLGTSVVESKTGYGLSTESELNTLKAMAILHQELPVTLIPTFLGAHAIPPEYKGRSDAYTQVVIEEMLPQAAAWYAESVFKAESIPFFVDVFCEENAFTVEQTRRIVEAGIGYGMRVKLHVDEFNALGAVLLGIDYHAVSLDHLDVTPLEQLEQLAASETIGIVLPTVNFNLGSSHFANARYLIDAGGALAIATDINPGSAPSPSMPFVMAVASRYQRLLPAETITASTINAAYAVGLGEQVGSIEVGKWADILILKTPDYRHLAYRFADNLVEKVIVRGKFI